MHACFVCWVCPLALATLSRKCLLAGHSIHVELVFVVGTKFLAEFLVEFVAWAAWVVGCFRMHLALNTCLGCLACGRAPAVNLKKEGNGWAACGTLKIDEIAKMMQFYI